MEFKLCRYCLQVKPADTFGQAATVNGKVYRRHRCAECKNEIQTKRIQRLRLWIEDYKKARSCERCGYADYRALTFHHLDKKSEVVCRGTGNFSWSVAGFCSGRNRKVFIALCQLSCD